MQYHLIATSDGTIIGGRAAPIANPSGINSAPISISSHGVKQAVHIVDIPEDVIRRHGGVHKLFGHSRIDIRAGCPTLFTDERPGSKT